MKLHEYIKKNEIEDYIDSLERAYQKSGFIQIPRDELQALIEGVLLLVQFYNTAKKKDLSDEGFRDYFKTEVAPLFEGD